MICSSFQQYWLTYSFNKSIVGGISSIFLYWRILWWVSYIWSSRSPPSSRKKNTQMFAVAQGRMLSVLYASWKRSDLWVDKRRLSLDIIENFMGEENIFKESYEVLNPFFMHILYSLAFIYQIQMGLWKMNKILMVRQKKGKMFLSRKGNTERITEAMGTQQSHSTSHVCAYGPQGWQRIVWMKAEKVLKCLSFCIVIISCKPAFLWKKWYMSLGASSFIPCPKVAWPRIVSQMKECYSEDFYVGSDP